MGVDTLEPHIGVCQMFQIYVAKVDPDAAYIAIAIHVYCKFMF